MKIYSDDQCRQLINLSEAIEVSEDTIISEYGEYTQHSLWWEEEYDNSDPKYSLYKPNKTDYTFEWEDETDDE